MGRSSPQRTVGFAHFVGTESCCRDEAAPGPGGTPGGSDHAPALGGCPSR